MLKKAPRCSGIIMYKPFAVLVNSKSEQHLVMYCDEPMSRTVTDSGSKIVRSRRVIKAMFMLR